VSGHPKCGAGAGATWLVALALTTYVCGCKKESAAYRAPLDDLRTTAALETYADIAAAAYGDAAATAERLLAAAKTLAEAPTAQNLGEAREAWRAARAPYEQTEAYRFYGGPIDAVEMLVNTWPVDEEYIESSDGRSGIVPDAARYPELAPALLASLNVKAGETSVTTGYHAIEFLLWGKDTRKDGPGDREASAFDPAEPLGSRRSAYLVSACELLVQHLHQVAAEWQKGNPSNYRARFVSKPRREALTLVVKGMGALSGPELSGERMTVAYETKAQENEHSCFSDTTVDDLSADAAGIRNVCLGRYRTTFGTIVAGPGLCEVVEELDPALGARLKSEIGATAAAVRAIPSPFDQSILGMDDAPGRVAVAVAIQALETQTESLRQAGALLAPAPSLAAVP
jgi:putative iron-regulated protein